MGSLRLALQNELPSAVKMSGAVSPATRAKASMHPVMIPGEAVLTVMERTDRQFDTPRASAASRTAWGTMSNISSVVRQTVGIIMMPRATPPESAEKWFCGTTMSEYAARPMLGAAAELGEIDSAGNADGDTDGAGDTEQDTGTENCVGHAAADLTDRLGNLGKKGEVERAGAFIDEIAEDGHERSDHEQGGEDGQRSDCAIRDCPDLRSQTVLSGSHAWLLS